MAQVSEDCNVVSHRLRLASQPGTVAATPHREGQEATVTELPKLLYSTEEAAQILRMGKSTLQKHMAAGRVPHRRMLNGDRGMTLEDIEAVLEAAAFPAITAP